MEYTICTREFERDYFWDNAHASPELAETARSDFFPAFEGSMTTSRFAALLRRPGSPEEVVLCVSVSTDRKDFRHRPIRTMAFLQAEKEPERNWLSSFFAECLCHPDKETLYNASSPLAKAVESLYQTHGTEEFEKFCQSLPVANGDGKALVGNEAIPRADPVARKEIAATLPATLRGTPPSLLVLTDREPAAVLESLGTLFGPGTVRIFSKAVSEAKELPEKGGPKKYWLGGGLGITVAFCCILLAVHTYSGRVATRGGGCGGSEGGSDQGSLVVVPDTPEVGKATGTMDSEGALSPPEAPKPEDKPIAPANEAKPDDAVTDGDKTVPGVVEQQELPDAADGVVPDAEPSEEVNNGKGDEAESDTSEAEENSVPPEAVEVEETADTPSSEDKPIVPASEPHSDDEEIDGARGRESEGGAGPVEEVRVPPAWVVTDVDTAARAEAGDVDAMGFVADGYMDLATSENIEASDEERQAMFREAMSWVNRRAKIIVDREGDIDSVRKRAEAGDAAAQRNLGYRYSLGIDVEKDEALAFEWTKKAAEQGDAKAMFNLANDYAKGQGVGADAAEALGWYRKAAGCWRELVTNGGVQPGDCQALVIAGQGLLGEEGVSGVRDPELGMEFLELAALAGDATAQAEAGLGYMLGNGVPQDMAKAVEWWRKAAEGGECLAMLWLGNAYERGDGVAKDDCKAKEYWERSHAAGCPEATERLLSLADEYREGAEAGDVSAQFFMGAALECGYGTERDAGEAVAWYRKAAEQGHPGAQAFLGYALLAGEGTEKNAEEAVEWFRKAAGQGNSEAQQNLGLCLFYGNGCEENRGEAAEWYRKAAEQGEAGAMFNLGACYRDGTGVPEDPAAAVDWFRRAAALGHPRAAAVLEQMGQE